jgi:hypothetical protein
MKQTNPSFDQPRESPIPSAKKKLKNKWLLLIPIILVALAAILYFIFTSPEEPTTESEFEAPETHEPSFPTPTPTPEPIDRSQISISVLNGTGIAKEASFLKNKLEELGYSEIQVGNADDQTHSATEVTISPSVPDQLREELEEKLNEIYQDVEIIRGTPGDADIRVVTGLRTGQSLPTPTPTIQPTPTATESASPTPTPTPTS